MFVPVARRTLPPATLALSLALLGLLLGLLHPAPAARAQAVPVSPAGPAALGRVAGVVTDDQGRPLPNMQVDFFSEIHPNPNLPWTMDSLRTVTTDAQGRYMTALPPGIYRVRFSDPEAVYAQQYYRTAQTVATAADVVVAGNQVDGISAQLGAGSTITGTVPNGDPLIGFSIVAFTEIDGVWQAAQEVPLGAAQTYTLRGLPAGVYRVCLAFTTGLRTGPLPCYDKRGGGPASATDVLLPPSTVVPNIDIAVAGFTDLAALQGKVTDAQNAPLADVLVRAATDRYETVTTTTDAAGAYTLSVLAPASVRVQFSNPGGLYASQWYTQAASAGAATAIFLQPAEVRSGIDAALALGGRITGTITLSGVTPGGLLDVLAVPAAQAGDWNAPLYDAVYAPRTGEYRIGGLPPGAYRVCIRSWQFQSSWYFLNCLAQRADGAPPTVTVSAGATVPGVDFFLAVPPAPEGFVLTGTVVSTGGAPLGGVEVELHRAMEESAFPPGTTMAKTVTEPDGSYRFEGLYAGRYRLRAVDPADVYAAAFYRKPGDSLGGSNIYIDESLPPQPVDVRLDRGGALSGQVRRADGQALPYAQLHLYVISPEPYDWPDVHYAGSDGRFHIGGLPVGRYRVCAEGAVPPRYGLNCYGSLPDDFYLPRFTPVEIQAGTETAGIDVTLGPVPRQRLYLPQIGAGAGAPQLAPAAQAQMGRISGHVRNAQGDPLAGIYVDLYQAQAPTPWTGPRYMVQTGADGGYRIEPLDPGLYRVAFHDPANVYAQQFYSGSITFAAATTVAINGSFADEVDAALTLAGGISGTVVGGSTPDAMPVGIFANVDGDWQLVQTAEYDLQRRTYVAQGLPPGVYRVCGYSGEAPAQATGPCYDRIGGGVAFAADVQVVAGTVTDGVDLTAVGLVDGGSIHGTVRGEGGAALAGIEVNIYAPAGSSGAPQTAAWMQLASTKTDAAGSYGFADLLPNDYVLEYRNPGGIYYTQYYGNERSIAHAQVISIGRSEQRAAVDITLAPGGMIEGTVLLDGSLPPAAAVVAALNVELGTLSPFTASYDAQSGAYRVGGLPPGGYKVRAEVPYLPTAVASLTGYHRAARDWYDATVITITAGSRLRNIDIVLAQDGFNGVIAGTISGDGGLPLGGMTVELYRSQLDWLLLPRLVYTTTDTGGRYQFDGLLDGFYYVRVLDPGGAYSPGYSGDQVLADLAQPVLVEKGLAPGPVDLQMLRSATLRGRVYDQDGKPVAGARVYLTAYRGPVSTAVTMTLTGASGSYASGPLPPAQYSACAYLSRDNGNDNGCYGGRQGSQFQLSLFELLPGAVLANIDIYFGGTPGMADQLYIPTVQTPTKRQIYQGE